MIAHIMAAKPRGPKKSIIVVASLAVMFCIALVLDVPVSTWCTTPDWRDG